MHSDTCILVATPCFGGMLAEAYFNSMIGLQRICVEESIGLQITTMGNESLVTRARNTLVALFLDNPTATHLLFIDADIGFPPELVLRMLAYDKPVTCSIYPRKAINWNGVAQAAAKGVSTEKLESHGLEFNLAISDYGHLPLDQGFIEVSEGATGFMLIKREAFTLLKQTYPELRYNSDQYIDGQLWSSENTYLFFDTMVDQETNRYLSEDYAFCKRWQQAGGKIYADVTTVLTHYGTYAFKGSIANKHGVSS